MQTVAQHAAEIATGRKRSIDLTEDCLERIADRSGEGARVYTAHDPAKARAQAEAMDRLAKAGIRLSPIHGLPVSLKDLLDVEGEVTRAGSKILDGAPAAKADATVVRRLRQAGAVIIGRTNMTEFAYGGIGYNPHYGTPASPWDRRTGRVPGGSSSGAAVSVSDGMAVVGIGTDTGGSCRIPAAFCGVVGYKPTVGRIPTSGAFALSSTLDSIGPLANSVACAATVDAILAGEAPWTIPEMSAKGLRIAVPQTYVLDQLDAPIASAFERTLSDLSKAGAVIATPKLEVLARTREMFAKGGIAGAEAYELHREWLAGKQDLYDRKVALRILPSKEQSAADYIALHKLRECLTGMFDREAAGYDALAMPTTPILPPPIRDFGDHQPMDDYMKVNGLSLRNTYVGNIFTRCAISIPCHRAGDPVAGLMLIGERNADRHLLAVAQAIESVLTKARSA
jgi:aspartyl-tRNA(Asn)/glutamyl-tRNA(Gln) amidotransferase subunit A